MRPNLAKSGNFVKASYNGRCRLAAWMKSYKHALEALYQPGVEAACGHMAHYHTLVGMVARQVKGNHSLHVMHIACL